MVRTIIGWLMLFGAAAIAAVAYNHDRNLLGAIVAWVVALVGLNLIVRDRPAPEFKEK